MNAMSAVLKKEEDDVLPDDCDAPIDHGWAWMVCLGKNELLFFCLALLMLRLLSSEADVSGFFITSIRVSTFAASG